MDLSRPVVVQRHSYLPISTCQIRQHFGQTLRNPYLWNRWMDLCNTRVILPWSSGSNFENALSQEWEGRLAWNHRNMSRYDVRSTLWLWTMTSPMTLALIFKVKFWKSHNSWMDARLTWNKTDVSRYDVRPTLWLWTVTSPMTLTLYFQGQILKKS